MAEYYININGQQLGPFPANKLVSNGATADTMVWTPGMPSWELAKNVPELAPLFPAPSPPPAYQQPSYQQPAYQQPSYQQPQSQQYYQQPQQYQQRPQYASQGRPQSAKQRPMPDSNLVWGIICLLICCLPLGIVSVIKASDVAPKYNRGDYQGALKASQDAKSWAIYGMVIGGVVGILYVIFVFVVGVSNM
jgi:hypothetical protein